MEISHEDLELLRGKPPMWNMKTKITRELRKLHHEMWGARRHYVVDKLVACLIGVGPAETPQDFRMRELRQEPRWRGGDYSTDGKIVLAQAMRDYAKPRQSQ